MSTTIMVLAPCTLPNCWPMIWMFWKESVTNANAGSSPGVGRAPPAGMACPAFFGTERAGWGALSLTAPVPGRTVARVAS